MSIYDRGRAEPEPDDGITVTADDCERLMGQAEALAEKRRNLTSLQEGVEDEARDLRTLAVLGKATESDDARRDSLLERSAIYTADLREIARLTKLTTRALGKAQTLRQADLRRIDIEREGRIAGAAKERLEDAQNALVRAGIEYAALWALSNREKAYLAARPGRVGSAMPRNMEPMVSAAMAELKQGLDNG